MNEAKAYLGLLDNRSTELTQVIASFKKELPQVVDYGVLMVPVGFVEGLPAGIQIIGRRFREDLILDAMAVVERHVGVVASKLWASQTAVSAVRSQN